MNSLKKTIENTLINNLDIEVGYGIELESIERCSDYIAQEMKEVAIEFVRVYLGLEKLNMPPEIFDQFIADRYKDEEK